MSEETNNTTDMTHQEPHVSSAESPAPTSMEITSNTPLNVNTETPAIPAPSSQPPAVYFNTNASDGGDKSIPAAVSETPAPPSSSIATPASAPLTTPSPSPSPSPSTSIQQAESIPTPVYPPSVAPVLATPLSDSSPVPVSSIHIPSYPPPPQQQGAPFNQHYGGMGMGMPGQGLSFLPAPRINNLPSYHPLAAQTPTPNMGNMQSFQQQQRYPGFPQPNPNIRSPGPGGMMMSSPVQQGMNMLQTQQQQQGPPAPGGAQQGPPQQGAQASVSSALPSSGPTMHHPQAGGVMQTPQGQQPQPYSTQQPQPQQGLTSTNPATGGLSSSMTGIANTMGGMGGPLGASMPNVRASGEGLVPPAAATPTPAAAGGAGAAGAMAGTGTGAPNAPRQVKFENALDFLDQVKLQFARQPRVYNQFLDIMKDFKAQYIDTPGVIQRVAELFRGHKHLILGFNTFLPPNCKIEVDMIDSLVGGNLSVLPGMAGLAQQQTVNRGEGDESRGRMQPSGGAGGAVGGPQGLVGAPGMFHGGGVGGQVHAGFGQQQGGGGLSVMSGMGMAPGGLAPNQPLLAGQRRAPEFDHARNYVKKIKLRFQHQPHVYKAFLEILHTYHKEQHTIKDVYEQVAKLFADHTDLLDEFTQFLPDNTQQGPPSAAPAGQKADARPNLQFKNANVGGRGGRYATPAFPKGKEPTRGTARQQQALQAQEERYAAAESAKDKRGGKPRGGSSKDIDREAPANKRAKPNQASSISSGGSMYAPMHEGVEDRLGDNKDGGTHEELDFFFRVKSALGNQRLYHEFLKCMHLFSREIIARGELVLLVKDLLGRHVELFEWFKSFIGVDDRALEALETQQDREQREHESGRGRSPQRQPWSVIDYNVLKRCGSSYRQLPRNNVPPRCSGRTELCNSVLNDAWVSVPTGSEDFSFKNQRKNQYEEVLFKCEDERYELDLVIELNSSAIRTLEAISKRITGMSEEEAMSFKLDQKLDVLVIRSIERLYGEKGGEVVDGLYQNPVVAIPIVIRRLKQKDQEWVKARREWSKVWREVAEKNHYKSLDHQSFYFKQSEKKTLGVKALIAEIKAKYVEQLKHKGEDKLAEKRGKEREKKRTRNGGPLLSAPSITAPLTSTTPWHLEYLVADSALFKEVLDLMLYAADRLMSKADRDKLDSFMHSFLVPFFAGPSSSSWSSSSASSSSSSSSSTSSEHEDGGPVVTITSEKDGQPSRTRHVLYGNNTFYIFLRLFQILYDRLAKAKELAVEAEINKWHARPTMPRPPKVAQVAPASSEMPSTPSSAPAESDPSSSTTTSSSSSSSTTTTTTTPSELESTTSPMPVDDPSSPAALNLAPATPSGAPSTPLNNVAVPPTAPSTSSEPEEDAGAAQTNETVIPNRDRYVRYASFTERLYLLIAGAIDQTTYEDELRVLLGIGAFMLCTVDKLIFQVVRQLQALLASETCQKVLQLHQHESQRVGGPSDALYHSAVAEVLLELDERERLFLFEYEMAPVAGRFTFTLLDVNSAPIPKFMDLTFEPERYSDYVASFLSNPSSAASGNSKITYPIPVPAAFTDMPEIDAIKARLFLLRNLQAIKKVAPAAPVPAMSEDKDAVVASADAMMSGVVNHANLECRIALSNFRLFYVEDTEDFFYRAPGRGGRKPKQGGQPTASSASSSSSSSSSSSGGDVTMGEASASGEASRRATPMKHVDLTRLREQGNGSTTTPSNILASS